MVGPGNGSYFYRKTVNIDKFTGKLTCNLPVNLPKWCLPVKLPFPDSQLIHNINCPSGAKFGLERHNDSDQWKFFQMIYYEVFSELITNWINLKLNHQDQKFNCVPIVYRRNGSPYDTGLLLNANIACINIYV